VSAERSFRGEALLRASPDAVWNLLADLGNREVAADFDAIEVTGVGEGAVRTLHLPEAMGGGVLRERIERFDPAQRSYEYRVFDFAALRLSAYRARLEVVPDGKQARLRYQSHYAPLTSDDTAASDALAQGAFGGLVAQLERVLRGGT
jgi:hypothetical protein